MKWIVSVQFSRPKAYHLFFKLINRKRIKDTVLVNYSHTEQIVEFETTTKPEEQKIKQMGAVVNVKILEIK